MNKTGGYDNLNFQRQPRRIAPQIIAALVAIAVFTLLWLVIPQTFLYWLLVIPLACLSWVASYGFRHAVSDLIKLLQRLERL